MIINDIPELIKKVYTRYKKILFPVLVLSLIFSFIKVLSKLPQIPISATCPKFPSKVFSNKDKPYLCPRKIVYQNLNEDMSFLIVASHTSCNSK
jgi:hypothetical protein